MAEPSRRWWFGRRAPAILIGNAVVLALLAGFGAGFGYARSAGSTLETQPSPTALPAGEDYALLYEIRGLIESEFFKPDDAERTRLLYGAARGMV
jgi:hypothetical protein